MKQKFYSSDSVLEELVTARRKEVVTLQKREAEQLKDIEKRGQKQLQALTSNLGSNAELFDQLEKSYAEEADNVEVYIKDTKASLKAAGLSAEASRESLGFNSGVSLSLTTGWLTPYYATLHGSDGSVYWQGYNPGNFDLGPWAKGAGSGVFGTGAGSFTVYLDWWFTFRADASRFYSYDVWVPFHGYYILYADDGFWTSKEASASIDLCAQGYQYNYKPKSCTNVFSMDSQNINVNDRFDGWRKMYYSDLLGADQAYLLVTASFHVYARGSGSYSELNFAAGDANYVGVPYVYVS